MAAVIVEKVVAERRGPRELPRRLPQSASVTVRPSAMPPINQPRRDDERPLPWGQQRTYIKGGRVGTAPSGGGFTQNQKMLFGLVAVLVGPSLVKKWSEKPASEKVDLSMYKIVTEYKTPAIDKLVELIHDIEDGRRAQSMETFGELLALCQ